MKCTTCDASFGKKPALAFVGTVNRYYCESCHHHFCSGHLILSKDLDIHSDARARFPTLVGQPRLKGKPDERKECEGTGLCLPCILRIWNKHSSQAVEETGILDRAAGIAKLTVDRGRSLLTRAPAAVDLVKIRHPDVFITLNEKRARTLLLHQKDITADGTFQDFWLQDLRTFARVYAVSQKRDGETSISLTDVYRLMDWLRDHENIPKWIQSLDWDVIESSPGALSYVSDVWSVTQVVLNWSNPAVLTYQVGNMASGQMTGQSLLSLLYDKVKVKLDLNLNLKAPVVSYASGLFILQLLQSRQATIAAQD
ncbi:hypothetical protein LJR143_002271 [Pseudoxanthomonas sp. LjRoot143]|uniref:hypothetical protein n=1 Tax=Pseudoxanthomonas sp. LjRoot143 TaxID=3342266 RepID=UPI003ECC64D6